jgi:hypothetical protein
MKKLFSILIFLLIAVTPCFATDKITVLDIGQSNSFWLGTSSIGAYSWGGNSYTASNGIRQYSVLACGCSGCTGTAPAQGSWLTPTANGFVTLGNALVAATGKNVDFLNYNLSGSVLLAKYKNGAVCGSPPWYWLDDQYDNMKTAVLGIISGSVVNFIIWWQGYSDGANGATQAEYYAGLQTLSGYLKTDFPSARLIVVKDAATSSAVNAATVQAVTNGYASAYVDLTDLTYDNSPDIGPAQATTAGSRLATTILAMPPVYTISGTVSGVVQSGVTVTLTGTSSASTTTASDGTYSFTVTSGSYTITPSLTGYTFSPTSSNQTVSNANITGVNFTDSANASTYSISGIVSGSVVSGIKINLTGPSSASTTTSNGGQYSFTGLPSSQYNYIVTPTLSGYSIACSFYPGICRRNWGAQSFFTDLDWKNCRQL